MDKTFCEYYKECKDGASCDRALTDKVIESANEWWGSDGAPISSFTDKPECFNIDIDGIKQ